jgi:UDP-N-acetyl-D-glucosamine/UDP-N-acetyl-D-galactosamine dehydrogenase
VINKIFPCIVGLGYVGLPVFNRLQKKFKTIGFDTNKLRILSLKKRKDINNEFNSKELKLNNNSFFSNNLKDISMCNFYIVTVPTPLKNNNIPDLSSLISASNIITKFLKKNDIVIFESTVYPGTTKILINDIFHKKTNLREGKDFFVGYSPERINPGDKSHLIKNTPKILAFNAKPKLIKNRILKVYNSITNKLHLTNSIQDAETAKVIENIQRDLNIAFMNDIYLFSNKMKFNFKNIVRLAGSKWNFLNFKPGLVGGHCLPVDPYYLYYIAKKNNISLKTVLAGRQVNSQMKKFIYQAALKKITEVKKDKKNLKTLIVGVTYKSNVADVRNSIALEIFIKLKKNNKNIDAYDYICSDNVKKKYSILKKFNKNKYELIIFLVNHKKNIKIYDYAIKNNIKILDPLNFY